MKIFKLMTVALVAMFGFIACDKHECNDYDHSADIVGTWTCHEAGYAEALVIKADGSVLSTGVENGEFWENVKGNIVVENGTITMTFEDNDNFKGHFDIVPGVAFSIFTEEGDHMTYYYCKEDLSDEIVGMWVCTYSTLIDVDMGINTYNADGKALFTGFVPWNDGYMLSAESTYKVIGDLMIQKMTSDLGESTPQFMTFRLEYAPNGSEHGDVLTSTSCMVEGDEVIESSASYLRVKQTLDLAGKKYDYIKTFVTNVDGLDKDINFMGFEFNFAKMDGVKLDKMLKTLLFNVEFPDANTIKYACHYNNEPMSMDAPIVVDGNKMTVKMSTKNAAYKDVDLYTYQDKDNTQMHMYMPTYAFVNFFGNMQATMMSQMGNLDLTDAAAVKAVFDSIDEAVNTINVSFVMEKAAK